MAAKRALVVDDSRSARAFLTRLLREQKVEVDGAETAEQALEYLTQNRPDVIFMDHLMPGMDGFQAVQAIKGNPDTAMIPILMYTSQEGELYLGQARALGAVGVLPKTVEQADVRTVLQQLHLLDEPDTVTVATQQEVLEAAEAAVAAVKPEPQPDVHKVEEILKDEVALLRRHLSDTLDTYGKRVLDEMHALLTDALPQPPINETPEPRHSPVPWLLALAASVVAAVLGTMLWQNTQQLGQIRAELADARSNAALLTARLAPLEASAAAAQTAVLQPAVADGAGGTLVARVPFGEPPFAGARIAQLRELVSRLVAQGRKGSLELRRHVGRFCLAQDGSDSYQLADATQPFLDCGLVADADDPVLGNTVAESVEFASVLGELREQHGELIAIDVVATPSEGGNVAYPEIGGSPPRIPTAGEWNAAAARNNRVEMIWHPAS